MNANTVSFQPRQSAGVTNTPALSGQCPVTLKHQREWKTGDPRFAVKHRGRVYWMSSQEAMQEFLFDPDGSSPVMAGYDPLIFLQEGRLVDGDIRYGWHEGNTGAVYLFSSQQSKQQYQENFEANTRALETVLNSRRSSLVYTHPSAPEEKSTLGKRFAFPDCPIARLNQILILIIWP